MTLKWKLKITIPIVLFTLGIVCWSAVPSFRFWIGEAYYYVRPVPRVFKNRTAQFNARAERIRQDAKSFLKIGAKKNDVARFFASENIPVSFNQVAGHDVASGEVYVAGIPECANVACGDDSALIGVRVDVDENGTVISDPVIVSMYTNCL